MGSREGDIHRGSILGQPTGVTGEYSILVGNSCNFRYITKLEFPKFNGDDVDEWLFKVEQIFLLDKTPEQSRITMISLHLEGYALYWHNFLKMKGRIPN